jgi:phage-related protein
MPTISVVFYRDDDGTCPLLEWLDSLPRKAQDKCVVRIERLKELGHELRRPEADYLRDGVYELRAKHSGINYRMLYFFHERTAVVLSHGIMKQAAEVPPKEIELAMRRKRQFVADPKEHTYEENP